MAFEILPALFEFSIPKDVAPLPNLGGEMSLKEEKERLKQWTTRIPEQQQSDDDDINVLRLAATNDAYHELCKKLARIMIHGSTELRTTIVTNLVLSEDAVCGGTSISYDSIARDEDEEQLAETSKGGAQ
jgi:hypothetical protein